jgi:hypothetical protein
MWINGADVGTLRRQQNAVAGTAVDAAVDAP